MIKYVKNENGPILGYSTTSGMKIIKENGLLFKDLNKSGKLEPYKDWRLPAEERAKDLASKMTVEQIAGLMLYSSHQSIPAASRGFFASSYNGKHFEESGAKPWDLSDQQKEFLVKDHLRHVLITTVQTPEIAARWSNEIQALAEGVGMGIPVNNSSDPRHGSDSSKEFNEGAGGTISMWPEPLGLAATFNPKLVQRFGEVAAKEYRALGLTTALSPQIDIATDPRWNRFNGTFGEDSQLARDLGRAYIDGFQTSEEEQEIADGWGYESVNAMVKHWPGGGSGEAGRDAHWGFGKYAVYPGENFNEHLIPFIDGAFKLKGKTKSASAVMPYYTISFNQATGAGENVGNSYNSYLINELLRSTYEYDGVVCTDWLITADQPETVDQFAGKPWGVETLSVAERHYKLLMAGVDQFGGNNQVEPVLEAYEMGVKEHGEAFMRKRLERSAVRLLKNIFRLGLFENPYLVVKETVDIVGNPQFMAEGYEAQLQSIVMLKNKENLLPIQKGKTVYIPKRFYPEKADWFGNLIPSKTDFSVNLDVVQKYYQVTDNPEEADFALIPIFGPDSGSGYSSADREAGGTGYVPISLQYKPYTAELARSKSIAGDPDEVVNRTYKGKTITTSNELDVDLVLQTKELMKGKPVIVSMLLSNPAIVQEFESEVDSLLVHFGVQDQAIMDVLSGEVEPSGLLPMQMPADMKTVEEQHEDRAHDMVCHQDESGNVYDFGFGLNWSGVIDDERTKIYKKGLKEINL
ncbi:glycoside hydrolase family 3 C-terminal domain-containing protein [Alkalihalobacillus sp. MEB130]|uniref:glycoside hydrolase family 3 protein n=1 Tax=Alkalihalobacillus sp. MEB130 TaxID=2976704 RepID=UPI0028DE365C|nr:glycoside hydrolase family 3 N-terminal domain-containing protein [Alkalihalobacillus sp. MEB130]MDT8861814.1 glycoside hydrolase family 3 C-terminal domain-containing protein [Alkalihalobacillus sp. MEB130]